MRPRQTPENERKVPLQRSYLPRRTQPLETAEHPRDNGISSQIHPCQRDVVQGCPVALQGRYRQTEFFAKEEEELGYLRDSRLAWIDTQLITPTKEPGPLGLVDWYRAAVECLRSEAATRATFLEKPAFWMRRWITSTREDGGSRGLDGTFSCVAGQEGSTLAEAREVHLSTVTEGLQTTPSGATAEPTKLTRGQLRLEIWRELA